MKADKVLETLGTSFDLVIQENETKSCDDAARERGLETRQIVKSLILERHIEKGNKEDTELLHVLLPGDREISEKKFGESHLVTPEKSEEISGFESGTVHPLSTELKHIVDYRIFDNDRVSFTVGQKNKGVILDAEDFRQALEKKGLELEVKDICLTDDRDLEKLEEEGLDREDARFIAERGLTPVYRALDYRDRKVLTALRELNRYDLKLDIGQIGDLIEASDNPNHLQKIIEHFNETGEILKAESHDLENVIEEVIDERPEAVEELRDGKSSAKNFLVGQVMQKTRGQADPSETQQILEEKIHG